VFVFLLLCTSESFRDGEGPLRCKEQELDDSFETTWVENAALVTRAVQKAKIDASGFPSWHSYADWLDQGPIVLELNRYVFKDEEIISSYEWSLQNENPLEKKNSHLQNQHRL
jgi:hypothetical protein